VNPAAAASFTVGVPPSATAGAAFTVTVTAKDAYGNVVTGYAGTAHFTSSDAQAVLPADYTFSAADAGAHTFTNGVTLRTAGSRSVTATDTANASVTGSGSVTVGAAAAASLGMTASSTSVTAGTAFNVTLTARDAYGNVATGYRGAVHFTSSDAQATLPADYAFTAADNGAHTFGVTLRTAGTQSVTATDTASAGLTATLSGITVSNAPPGTGTNLAPSGTAYRWWNMATATATTNQTRAAGLNDGILTRNVVLSGGGINGTGDDNRFAYEAAGVVWSAAQSVNTVTFKNGSYNSTQDGVFDANFGLQFTTDGTTWRAASGWTLSSPYAYNSASAGGVTYTFSGPLASVRGFRMVGQVRTSEGAPNSWYAQATEVTASNAAPTGSGNLAAAGTAYRWSGLTSSTSNANRAAAAGLNDGNMANGVDLSGAAGDAFNAFEAAGVLWSQARTVNQVVFTNGAYTAGQDGVFDAGFKLQFTTDGTTWVDATGWTLSSPYAYNTSGAAGATYTFTGPATSVLGFRVVGQVHTAQTGVNSWYALVTELQAFGPAGA
jgi:hypothetical protein